MKIEEGKKTAHAHVKVSIRLMQFQTKPDISSYYQTVPAASDGGGGSVNEPADPDSRERINNRHATMVAGYGSRSATISTNSQLAMQPGEREK